MEVKHSSPLLPLRDIVVFPNMVIPLFVGRDKSITALNEVMKNNKKIILVTQKNSEVDDPKKTDVFMYGCESSILQLLKLPDGTVKVLVEGLKRVKLIDFNDDEKFITCSYQYNNDISPEGEDLMPLATIAIRRLEKLTSINKKISSEIISNIKELKDPAKIADNIASHLNSTISEKQQIFETTDIKKRLNGVIKIMESETSIIGVEKRIRGIVGTQMSNVGLESGLNKLGYSFKRADVGDKYVSDLLSKEGWLLGGEPSGHIICRDLVSTGDGTIAALKTISSLVMLEKDPKDVLSNYNKIPQINESINVINKDIVSDAEVKTAINDIKSDLTINRVLVRPSGTENKIRIMIESENKKTAKKYTNDLIKLFESKTA